MKTKGVTIDITRKIGGTVTTHDRFDSTCAVTSKTRERYGALATSLELISHNEPDTISSSSITVKIELSTANLLEAMEKGGMEIYNLIPDIYATIEEYENFQDTTFTKAQIAKIVEKSIDNLLEDSTQVIVDAISDVERE